MNYTGRPSISGCRPVLSLYPTHRFCQYLLLIFITFTNSFLFNRAFSTNSRRPLSHSAGVTVPPEGEELNLSVSADALPPPLPRGGFGIPQSFPSQFKVFLFARGSPTRGAVERSETERLYEGRPDREPLLGSTSPSLLRNATSPTEGRLWHSAKFSSPPEAPLLGELSSEARLRGCTKESPTISTKKDPLSEIAAPGGGLSFWVSQWTHLLLPLSLLLYAIPRKSQALHRKFTVALLFPSPVSFWRNVWYNGFAVHPAYLTGEEVDALAYFLTFLVSVGADVVSHFICKWLDRCEENRKA